MSEFDGQIAVITGAAQGIGYATAEKLKQDGAKIVIWDMDKNLGETAAQKLDCDFLQPLARNFNSPPSYHELVVNMFFGFPRN